VSLYNYRKAEWEEPYLEYQDMRSDDPNFVDEYRVNVPDDADHNVALDKIRLLEKLLLQLKRENKNEVPDVQSFAAGSFVPFTFDRHLYHPLIHIDESIGMQITVKPVHLNEGEHRFVLDLQQFYNEQPDAFAGKELFLLRNKSKEGIGFFEAGNFYPDFIMWLVDEMTQHVVFIDPKGIRNLDISDDLKLNFHAKLKEKEAQLGEPNIKLHSYIISRTPFDLLINYKSDQSSLEAKNILFQHQGSDYVRKMFSKVLIEE
jgi:hypothetical protein